MTVAPARSASPDSRLDTAARIFRGALAFNAALTVFWFVTFLAGGSFFFSDYTVNAATLGRVFVGVLVFNVIWGGIWWAIKAALLRWFVGFSSEESAATRSRRAWTVPTTSAPSLQRYSERRIRITDMIGRRGRFITLAPAGFYYLYVRGRAGSQTPNAFASAFFQDNLLERSLQLDLPRLLLRQRLRRRVLLRSAVARHGRRARARQLPADLDAVGGLQVRDGADRGAAR